MTSGFFGILHYGRLYWINVQSIHRLSLGGDYPPQTSDVGLGHVTCYGQWDVVRNDNEVLLSRTVKTSLVSSFPLPLGRQCLRSGSSGSQGPAVRTWGRAGLTHREHATWTWMREQHYNPSLLQAAEGVGLPFALTWCSLGWLMHMWRGACST